ncbi:MAG: patatin-like phospholipase family protein [Gemmataceae bacterium]
MTAKKVAIACQGGGTHAAFTWGVLTQILETQQRWKAEANKPSFEITALSGTSAGALCALATWYGLAPNTADPECGTPDKAMERLNHLWTTFAATTPAEQAFNEIISAALNLKEQGVPLPTTDPYSLPTHLGLMGLTLMGARKEYLSFGPLLHSLCPDFQTIDWPKVAESKLRMVAGAIEIKSGNFEAFDSHKTLEEMGLRNRSEVDPQYEVTRWRMRRALSLQGVAASGTLPEILPAQKIPNTAFPTCTPSQQTQRDAFYWDGLYSQNPPVRLLLDEESKEDKADEIWVIRINPQEVYREVTSLEDLRDRENDLAGNISLNAQLDGILTLNNWLRKYGDKYPPLSDRKLVTVRTIKMRRETAWGLHVSTKLNRSRNQMDQLHAEGKEVAEQWLAGWRTQGDDFDCYPNDARYS